MNMLVVRWLWEGIKSGLFVWWTMLVPEFCTGQETPLFSSSSKSTLLICLFVYKRTAFKRPLSQDKVPWIVSPTCVPDHVAGRVGGKGLKVDLRAGKAGVSR